MEAAAPAAAVSQLFVADFYGPLLSSARSGLQLKARSGSGANWPPAPLQHRQARRVSTPVGIPAALKDAVDGMDASPAKQKQLKAVSDNISALFGHSHSCLAAVALQKRSPVHGMLWGKLGAQALLRGSHPNLGLQRAWRELQETVLGELARKRLGRQGCGFV